MKDPFGIKRDVLKSTPNRVTALWLFGAFALISLVYIGVSIGHLIYGEVNDTMAFTFGLFFTLGVGSVIGWFTIILQESAQDVQIKVVQQKG